MLLCDGTPENPVKLTSYRDIPQVRKAQAFDWNGIKIMPGATGIRCINTRVGYSTFGLEIQSAETPVTLSRVSFYENGYTNCSRNGKLLSGNDTTALSFVYPDVPAVESKPIKATKKKPVKKKSEQVSNVKSQKPEHVRVKPAVHKARMVLGLTTGIAGVATVAGLFAAQNYYSKYDAARDPDLYTPAQVKTYKDKCDGYKRMSVVSAILTGAAVAGFGVTLFF
jgi:hypothetical protein